MVKEKAERLKEMFREVFTGLNSFSSKGSEIFEGVIYPGDKIFGERFSRKVAELTVAAMATTKFVDGRNEIAVDICKRLMENPNLAETKALWQQHIRPAERLRGTLSYGGSLYDLSVAEKFFSEGTDETTIAAVVFASNVLYEHKTLGQKFAGACIGEVCRIYGLSGEEFPSRLPLI